jgi:dTMP kinase
LDDPPPDTRDKIGEGLGEEPSTQVTIEISAFRKVLKTRSFMALWIGQGISSIGDWVIVGVLLDTVNRANPTWGVFFMLTFRFLPAFLFGLAAGAVVDRLERKTLMILCEISRCLLVIVLAFANSLVLICALVFTIECFSLLFGPAKDSSIPDLVKPDEVMTANSMMSTSTYLSMALGTLIATVILGLAALIHKFPLVHYVVANEATFQHEFAFIVDALTFLMSAMLLFTIAFPKRTTVTGQKFSARSIFSDLKEGLSFMRTNPLTRGILSGLMIGVVAGAAATPWLSRYLPAWKWFTRAVIGFGVSMFVFALVDFYALSLVVIFIGGCLLGYLLVSSYTLLHQNLSEEIRGRVFAAMQTIMRTCLLLSMGIFAGLQALFHYWIPWTVNKPVSKTLDLGIFHKSFYAPMLALMVGAVVVIVGGSVFMKSLHQYFREQRGGGPVEETGATT